MSKSFNIVALKPAPKKVVISLIEHLGDIVASEPVTRYIRKKYPKNQVLWVVKPGFRSLLESNPNIDKIVTVSCLSEWIYMRWFLMPFCEIIDLHVDKKPCSVYDLSLGNPNPQGITYHNYYHHGHLLHAFSVSGGLPALDSRPILYLRENSFKTGITDEYVVIHAASNDNLRNWTVEGWEQLVKYFIDEKRMSVVEVGLQSTLSIQSEMFHNYCGRASLNEIAEIIRNSSLFVGIDSSFAHFANALNVPAVILIGYYHHFKNYLPYSGLSSTQKDRIIYYQGTLKDLPAATVIERIEKLENSSPHPFVSDKLN